MTPIMCLVPDHEILELLQQGRLKVVGFVPEGLTPNGYDLRVAEVRCEGEDRSTNEGVATVPSHTLFFVSTVERVELPDDMAAQLWARTSWIRKGVLVGLGKVDAGFHGQLTFGAYNASAKSIDVPIGARFVQIVFERMSSPVEMTYEKRSGNYQGSQGITLRPIPKS